MQFQEFLMLILTRRVGETVMIGNEVTVTVLGVKGTRFVLASMLPRTFPCIAKRFMSASSVKKTRARACPQERSS